MIWWCSEHEASGRAVRCYKSSQSDVSCRMVEALLIVKENGEWPQSVIETLDDIAHRLTAGSHTSDEVAEYLDELAGEIPDDVTAEEE